jgi:hypothetical protein
VTQETSSISNSTSNSTDTVLTTEFTQLLLHVTTNNYTIFNVLDSSFSIVLQCLHVLVAWQWLLTLGKSPRWFNGETPPVITRISYISGLQPGVHEDILVGMGKHLTGYIKLKKYYY